MSDLFEWMVTKRKDCLQAAMKLGHYYIPQITYALLVNV